MLAETDINNARHLSDEESTINHHLLNECPPSYLQLLRQMFPRASKALDSDTWNESNRTASTNKIHNLRHQLCSFAKVISNGEPSLAITLLDRVSYSIRNKTNLEREHHFSENQMINEINHFNSTYLNDRTNSLKDAKPTIARAALGQNVQSTSVLE